jgi:hypothetical protein
MYLTFQNSISFAFIAHKYFGEYQHVIFIVWLHTGRRLLLLEDEPLFYRMVSYHRRSQPETKIAMSIQRLLILVFIVMCSRNSSLYYILSQLNPVYTLTPYVYKTHLNIILPSTGAGIARWYSAGIRAGWSRVQVPAWAGNFSLHHRVQTSSGAHSAYYPMCTRCSFSRG